MVPRHSRVNRTAFSAAVCVPEYDTNSKCALLATGVRSYQEPNPMGDVNYEYGCDSNDEACLSALSGSPSVALNHFLGPQSRFGDNPFEV